jgi:omega-amidase
MLKDLRVVAIQSKVPKTKDEGEAQIRKFLTDATAESVDMVGLPEDCVCSYAEIKAGYRPMDFLQSIAKEFNIYLFGATAVLESDGLHNRGFLIDRQGNIVGTHDKIVLIPGEVKDGVIAGNTLEIFDTEFGKIAILVCKDSFHRYAAWFFDKLRKSGVDIVLNPSYSVNVSPRSVELWTDSLKALAKWFDVYVVAPGTIGPNATKFPSFGHALIICPSRVTLAQGSSDKEEILRATLDVNTLDDIRNTWGSLWQPTDVPTVTVLNK